MMRRRVKQGALFCEVRLKERVSGGDLPRRVDAILDLSFVGEMMVPQYGRDGRPSTDPGLLLRMLIVGYLHGVRSERRFCEDLGLNLADRCFCRLDPDGRAPDHETFTKNRQGDFRNGGLMREPFEREGEQCLAAGLADTDHVVLDGNRINADANKQRCVLGPDWLPAKARARRCASIWRTWTRRHRTPSV